MLNPDFAGQERLRLLTKVEEAAPFMGAIRFLSESSPWMTFVRFGLKQGPGGPELAWRYCSHCSLNEVFEGILGLYGLPSFCFRNGHVAVRCRK